MKKQYATTTGFIANLVETAEELGTFNSQPITVYPTIEELLLELESENGKADKFFEDKNMPFSTWLIPKNGTLDSEKGNYQEYWQIEKTTKNSFSIKKVSLEFILATIDKKYIISFKYSFSKIEQHEKDTQIMYEEKLTNPTLEGMPTRQYFILVCGFFICPDNKNLQYEVCQKISLVV